MEPTEDFVSKYDDSDEEYDYSSDYSSRSFDEPSFEEYSDNDEQCSQQVKEKKYDVFTTNDVHIFMNKDIKDVTSVTSLPQVMTRVLLNFFHWDTAQLKEGFFIDGCAKLCEKAGLPNQEKSQIAETISERPVSEILECSICYVEYQHLEMKGVDCGHLFCSTCWAFYLQSVISQPGSCNKITCPAYKCKFLVDDNIVMELLEPNYKLKYQQLLIQSYVSCHRSLRWCPYPDCSYVIRMEKEDTRHVICKCSFQFCFDCGEGWHDPVPCKLLKRWNSKWNDDSENATWILENTKDCPKCYVSIEKNDGCNHMTCSNCTYEFCWFCFQPTESDHKCNLYKEEKYNNSKSEEKAMELDMKYKFFWRRYVSHTESLRLEKLYFANENLKQLNNSLHVDSMQKGFKILSSCRQTLQQTYIFAFYLERNNQSIIFDENQTNLETSIETLSKCLTNNLEYNETFDACDVQEKTFYCEQKRKNLIEHMREGNIKGWWKYFEDN